MAAPSIRISSDEDFIANDEDLIANVICEKDLSDDEYAENDSSVDRFFKAILNNDLDEVKVKIADGFTALTTSNGGDMALHFACLNSKLEVLSLLKETLREGEINVINVEDDDTICGTALHMSMDGQIDPAVVKTLLSWGADPSALDAKGSPILHEVIYRAWEDFVDKFRSEMYMLTHRISISTSEDKHTEVDEGSTYFEKVHYLCQSGADINQINTATGLCVLHFWCQNMQWAMADCLNVGISDWCFRFLDCLLSNGADVNSLSKRGDTPIVYIAKRSYKPAHHEFISSYRLIVRLLVSKIAFINRRDIHERSLLHISAELSNIVLMKELLTFKCQINAQDMFGLSALHITTHTITLDETDFVQDMIKLLVSEGANVNSQDKHGSTPLQHAIHMNNSTAVESLIKLGASTHIVDNCGRTAIDLAIIEGNRYTCQILGIVYSGTGQQSNEVTDVRHGLFYPQCCKMTYGGDTREPHTPEVVKNYELDDWLPRNPICYHNNKFVIQNSICCLETNKSQMKYTLIDAAVIKKEIFQMLQELASLVQRENELFASTVIFGGSVSEGTKVGSPDEFDFVFDLFKLRELVAVVEDQAHIGYAKLRVLNPEELEKNGLCKMIDSDGFLIRSATSNVFHQLMTKCLHCKSVWAGRNIISWQGTTDAHGECRNIGQLSMVWYGPFQKRQPLDIDIVPAMRLNQWQSTNVNKGIRLLDRNVFNAVGCYVVMKDLYRQNINCFGQSIEEADNIAEEEAAQDADYEKYETMFTVSLSLIEHAIMRYLPRNVRNGYTIAKSVQLQCPELLYNITHAGNQISSLRTSIGTGLISNVKVSDYVSSYILKTSLFYELNEQNIYVEFYENDLFSDTWNKTVLQSDIDPNEVLSANDLSESMHWALCIYRRLRMLLEEHDDIYTFFMPELSATTVRGGKKIFRDLLKVLTYRLEHFNIPEEFV